MKNTFKILLLSLALFGITISSKAQENLIEINFKQIQGIETEAEKTLKSIVKVRDISEQYATGGLYLMTHYGDLEEMFKQENQDAKDHPMFEQTWRFCSIFSTSSDKGILAGRNWDNQNVGSIIVSYYKPNNGYASVSFSRAIDMGFPLNVRIDEMAQSPFGNKLLLAPFYVYDGINEHGLFAAVTGINTIEVKAAESKEQVFIGYLIRKILDQTKSVDEAIQLADNYTPFDLNQNLLSCHFYVSDANGESVILEFLDGEWKKIYPDKKWQVMTNKVIYNTPDSTLRKKCWRYESVSLALEKANGNINWQEGMQILKDVSQKGTTWSVVYSPTNKDLYFSVYQTWEKVYYLNPF